MPRVRSLLLVVLVLATALVGLAPVAAAQQAPDLGLVPLPASVEAGSGGDFTLDRMTRLIVDDDAPAAVREVAEDLTGLLRTGTGLPLPLWGDDLAARRGAARPRITLGLGADASLGDEGYTLDVDADEVALRAVTAEGLFRGVQTLRQLLPAEVEGEAPRRPTRDRPDWTVPAVSITDQPRFEWRGAHLDVARHFMSVDEVKRYIDLIALYKINRFHMHLSDDQGWRVFIDSWPRLATYGGSLEVGGTPGGYYTQAEFAEIVEYANDRYITLVPEIDTPGHTNAALASYAELNCDGVAPDLYTGIAVGFSSLCIDLPLTYEFLDDVVGEISALVPGPYFHMGGDEAHETPDEDYDYFMRRAEEIVNDHGKTMVGWAEIAEAPVSSDAIAQYWNPASGSAPGTATALAAVEKGMPIIMSPASRAYLDMKYDEDTELGLAWAGFTEVDDAYTWDPATFVDGVDEEDIIGVEAALWSETLLDIDDVEFMAFPRLPAIAEIGWSQQADRDWEDFRVRLAAQAPHWDVLDVNYYRSPLVPWPDEATGGGGTSRR